MLEFGLSGETPDHETFLDELVETGYAGTELGDWGYMPTEPSELAASLRSREVELVGAFVPVALSDPAKHGDGFLRGERTARLMAAAGFDKALVILADENGSDPERRNHAGRSTPDLFLTSDEWATAAAAAETFAKRVHQASGLRTAFHHHCAGYVETPGEVEKLLCATSEELLGLVLDTGHYRFAGGYPEAAIQLFGERIVHVHFKDCSPEIAARSRTEGWDYFTSVGAGVFCELGTGEVDFPAITAQLKSHGYEGWIVVEQDVLPGMGTPRETAKRNRAYLASLGMVSTKRVGSSHEEQHPTRKLPADPDRRSD